MHMRIIGAGCARQYLNTIETVQLGIVVVTVCLALWILLRKHFVFATYVSSIMM
jgi:hypothetical protein